MSPPAEDEDTRLARELHARGQVPLPELQAALAEAQARRARGQPGGLREVLGARGLLPRAAGDAPQRLGNFLLGARIGSGAMGLVLEARHVVTGQKYALKLMTGAPPGSDPAALERFRREAQLGSRLEHRHIVAVVDADLDAPQPWIVHAFLPGGTLSERLRQRGKLPWPEAVALTIPLAEALAHAHERGVLHRDLKPANILFDAAGEPFLADFGLARETGASRERLTLSGEVLGTPNYMAPEQATGQSDLGPAADVYGLCAVLFHLLSGEPPFSGGSVLQILDRIVNRPLTTLAEHGVEVPAPLEEVLTRGLAKDPAARYRQGGDLAAALRACAEEQGPGDPAGQRSRGGPALLVGALLALLLGGLVGGAAFRSARGRAPSPTSSGSAFGGGTPLSSPSAEVAELLEASDLPAPPAGSVAWRLEGGAPKGAQVLAPVLWELPGRVAAPLAALERPGGGEAAFSGAAEKVSQGRWRVRYSPQRGLIPHVMRAAGSILHGLPQRGGQQALPPYRWLFEQDGRWLVGAPNDSAQLSLSAGRGRWRAPRIVARLGQERIDRGQILFSSGLMNSLVYTARGGSLRSPQRGSAPATWSGVQDFICEFDSPQGAVSLGGKRFEGLLAPPAARWDPPRSSPALHLTEGWFEVEFIEVTGEPLLGDVPALAEVPSRGSTALTMALRYRREEGLGGPCLELGGAEARLRLSADHEGLRLWRGELIVARAAVPKLPREGVLVLTRQGDRVEGWLSAGAERWRVERAIPLALAPGSPRYGATGARLEVTSATLWLEAEDPERAAHDRGGAPASSAEGAWRAASGDLEALVDPFLLAPELRGRAGAGERSRRLLACAERLRRAAPALALPLRRDALARALVASTFAGAVPEAQACGEALALLGAVEGREVLAYLGEGGLVNLFEAGQYVLTAAPEVATAGALGVRPLLPESAQAQVDWTCCRVDRLALEGQRGRALTSEARSAALRALATRLEGVAASGYRGPQGLEVLEDLSWTYLELGELERYETQVRALLAAAGTSPYHWIGHAEVLGRLGRIEEGAAVLLGGLGRGPANHSIRARAITWVQSYGERTSPQLLAAIFWALDQGAKGGESDWRQLSLAALRAALEGPRQSPRARDLCLFILRVWGLPLPEGELPSSGPLGRLAGWLEAPPEPALLQAAGAEDPLVAHLARFLPSLAPLLGTR